MNPDDPPDTPEEFKEILAAQAELMHDDPSTDMDAESRQDAGWLKFYVECPDCNVPMARTTVQSGSVDAPDGEDREKVRMHAVCPDCGAKETLLTIYKHTKPVGWDSNFDR